MQSKVLMLCVAMLMGLLVCRARGADLQYFADFNGDVSVLDFPGVTGVKRRPVAVISSAVSARCGRRSQAKRVRRRG